MDRHTILSTVGGVAAIGLAGCVADGEDATAPPTDTKSPTEETDTATETETDETQACTLCITELGYRASVAFDGGFPGRVSVRHSHGPGSSDVVTERER